MDKVVIVWRSSGYDCDTCECLSKDVSKVLSKLLLGKWSNFDDLDDYIIIENLSYLER